MSTRWRLARRFVPALLLAACGGGARENADGDGSGKGDEVDTAGERVCSLDEDEPRTLAQLVAQNVVQFRCRGDDGQFVETDCCAEQLDELVFATGCPERAKFDGGVGADKRCVEDHTDSSESVEGELVVPTVCCEALCDPTARWDDATTMDTCRASNGQFHPHVCCMMNDAARCGDASFDAEADALGYRHCRASAGDLAGLLAPGACCVDACFDILAAGEDVPIDCLLALDDECTGAAVDAGGLCRGEDGHHAKAACCLGEDGLAPERSDDCYLAELAGEDLAAAGCA
jgi:hypothetical protein